MALFSAIAGFGCAADAGRTRLAVTVKLTKTTKTA